MLEAAATSQFEQPAGEVAQRGLHGDTFHPLGLAQVRDAGGDRAADTVGPGVGEAVTTVRCMGVGGPFPVSLRGVLVVCEGLLNLRGGADRVSRTVLLGWSGGRGHVDSSGRRKRAPS